MIQALAPLQFFLLPATILLLLWSMWRTFFKKDKAAGLMLYVGLVIIVDNYMEATLPLSGILNVAYGSIRYSDILILWLLLTDSSQRKGDIIYADSLRKTTLRLLVVFFALFVYSAFRASTIGGGLAQFREIILKPILSCCVAMTGFRDSKDYEKLVIYFVVLGLIFSAASAELKFFDRLFLKGITYAKDIFWLPIRRDGRFGGFFLNPNNMGNFCVMLLPIHFAALIFFKGLRKKLFVITSLLALLFAFLLTESRGSFFGFFFSLLLLLFLPIGDMKLTHKIGAGLVFMFLFLCFMPGAIDKLTNRLDTLEIDGMGAFESQMYEVKHGGGVTMDDRLSVWEDGLKTGMTSPIFGIGLGEGKFHIVADELRARGLVTITLDHAHSSYLNIFIQAGALALIVFVAMNMIVLLAAFKMIMKFRRHELTPMLAGCSVGIVGFLVCLISQNTLLKNDAATLYWILIGIICALVGTIKHDSRETDKRAITHQ